VLHGRIATAEPADRLGFDLVMRLEERLGRAEAAVWRLDYQIATRAVGVGIAPDNAVTRFHLTGRVDWQLVRLATGAVELAATAQSFTAYSATGSPVAVLAAEESAATRLMRILADQIVTRLLAAGRSLSP
jgi:LPS-assembly lipoprotein